MVQRARRRTRQRARVAFHPHAAARCRRSDFRPPAHQTRAGIGFARQSERRSALARPPGTPRRLRSGLRAKPAVGAGRDHAEQRNAATGTRFVSPRHRRRAFPTAAVVVKAAFKTTKSGSTVFNDSKASVPVETCVTTKPFLRSPGIKDGLSARFPSIQSKVAFIRKPGEQGRNLGTLDGLPPTNSPLQRNYNA